MKNNYKKFLLVGAFSLISFDVLAGSIAANISNNSVMTTKIYPHSAHIKHNNFEKSHGCSGGSFPIVDMENLKQSIQPTKTTKSISNNTNLYNCHENLENRNADYTPHINFDFLQEVVNSHNKSKKHNKIK